MSNGQMSIRQRSMGKMFVGLMIQLKLFILMSSIIKLL